MPPHFFQVVDVYIVLSEFVRNAVTVTYKSLLQVTLTTVVTYLLGAWAGGPFQSVFGAPMLQQSAAIKSCGLLSCHWIPGELVRFAPASKWMFGRVVKLSAPRRR